MDTITISLQLSFDDAISQAEYIEFIDRFTTLLEREVAPGGELSLDDNGVCDFELEHERLDN